MTARGLVEKDLSERVLERGELHLTEREAALLGVPRLHTSIELRFGDDVFHADWHPREQSLRGEALMDRLQLYGTVHGLVRLHRRSGGLDLEIVERASRLTFVAPTPRSTVPAVQPSPAASGRFTRRVRARRVPTRYLQRDRDEYRWTASGRVGVLKESMSSIRANIEAGGWDDPELFDLRLEGERLAAVSSFDELMALGLAKVDHMPHQEATAIKVLARMQGRAILADEVGLGKTIEAGLILKELIVRGLAHRVLVICPASLRQQWADELGEKFGETFTVMWKSSSHLADRTIVSLNLVVRNSACFAGEPWDLVIVDEAHRLAGAGARKTRSAISELRPNRMLFLTATPVQNDLLELYRLVTLLRPGTFRSEQEFKRRFIEKGDARRPADEKGLRQLVSDVMVRTTREQAGVDKVTRLASDIPVVLAERERELYSVITTGLRRHLTRPADHLVQRQLAHRLTTSTRSLAVTAFRVAQRHPDPALKRLLAPFVDLCTDTRLTSRQQRLLELSQEWIADTGGGPRSKGRVLVFSQHTEVAEDLLRVYAAAGIEAVGYHGGLAASARRRAIDRFRTSARVMVSTESGAEGLNLQFCNAVINYDLPWNPMRIEQRIGRVHRLTQERDVFVANLYAVDTIDEHVYRILTEKLRMFELLFGQVTTILGELEDRDDGTFDQRIMRALLSGSDQAMEQKLRALGDDAQRARSQADKSISVGSHLGWMADLSHRRGLSTRGATELQPAAASKDRDSTAQMERFVRRLLEHLGAKITFETEVDPTGADGRHPFWSVDVPDELVDAFGRPTLHLAFTATALANHADAELCLVGSEFFDELLEIIREQGDLLAYLPPIRQSSSHAIPPHHESLVFVDRVCLGPADWSGRATWRVRFAGGASGERIVQTVSGDDTILDTRPGVAVPGGEHLPVSLGEATTITSRLARDCRRPLEDIADEHAAQLEQVTSAEIRRIAAHFDDQIEALEDEKRAAAPARKRDVQTQIDQLVSTRDAYTQAVRPEVELRAELIAAEIVGAATLMVEDRWQTRAGDQVVIGGIWEPDADVPRYVDATGEPIGTVAVCADRHILDESQMWHCPACDRDLCGECGPTAALRGCAVCSEQRCGECIPAPQKLCDGCRHPRRLAERDTNRCRTWQLGGGWLLEVGERVSCLVSPRGGDRTTLVADEDLVDPERAKLRVLAARHGLPPDTGLLVVKGLHDWAGSAHRVVLSTRIEHDVQVDPTGGSAIDGIVPDVPEDKGVQPDGLSTEETFGLSALVNQLRHLEPPPAAPRLVATPVLQTEWLELDPRGVAKVMCEDAAGRRPRQQVTIVPFTLRAGSASDRNRLVAVASTGSVRVEAKRVHRSIRFDFVDVDTGAALAHQFVGCDAEVSYVSEQRAEGLVRSLGLAPDAVVSIADLAPRPTNFADPRRATLDERTITAEWYVAPTSHGELPHPDRTFEDVMPRTTDEEEHSLWSLPESERSEPIRVMARRLLGPQAVFPVARGHWIVERWRGEMVRAVSYLVRAGERPWPTLDDTGERSADFAVDSDSHLHRADAGWTCPTCRRTGCSACRTEDQIDLCGDCSQPACGRCRRGEHERVVDVPRSCVICGVHACQRCGRDIDASSCPCCGRTVCGVCGAGDRCTTCASVRPLDTDEIGLLPEELHAVGLTVQSAVDHDARIIVLEGPTRREVAVLRNGAVVEWWRTGPLSAGLLPFVYATTRTGDVATIVETDDEDLAATTEAVRLYSSPRSVLTWRLEDDRGSTFGHSNAPLPIEDPHASDQDLIGVLAGDVASGRRLPLPIEDEIRLGRVRSLFSPVAAAPRFHLIIEPHRSEETVALQADGLAWSRIAGGRPFTTVEQWCRDANGPEAAGWHPSPQIVAWASAGPASASVLAFGPLIAIAISSDSEGEHPRHVIVRDVVDRTDVLSLGTYLTGSPAAVRVHRAVTPEQIIPIEVLNGQLEKRTFTPTCCPSSQGIGDDRVSEVLAAWPIPSVELPTFGSVPDAGFLWYGLLDTLGVLAEPTIPFCDIGASVEERWTTPYGTLTFTYEVNPDALSGAIHLLSGTFARRFYVDRSGHLVAVVRRCPYCSEETCDECSDVVAPCQLCGIEVCVRCAGSERTAHLCPACASLSPLGWWKRHGRPHLKGRERQVLRGMDARHQVDIVVDGRQVNLYQTKEGLDAPSTSPVMTTKLRDVLNTAFGAPIVPDVADKRLDGEAR